MKVNKNQKLQALKNAMKGDTSLLRRMVTPILPPITFYRTGDAETDASGYMAAKSEAEASGRPLIVIYPPTGDGGTVNVMHVMGLKE